VLEFPSIAFDGRGIDIVLAVEGFNMFQIPIKKNLIPIIPMKFGNSNPQLGKDDRVGSRIIWPGVRRIDVTENGFVFRVNNDVDSFLTKLKSASSSTSDYAIAYSLENVDVWETRQLVPRVNITVNYTPSHPWPDLGLFKNYKSISNCIIVYESRASVTFQVSPKSIPRSFPELAHLTKDMMDVIMGYIQTEKQHVPRIYVSPRNLKSIVLDFELGIIGTNIDLYRTAIQILYK
jgi:hypothetical protein